MTLAIAVATGDGLVVAADSRTTLTGVNSHRRVLSDHAHKVFQVGQLAVATYGWGMLLDRNIAGHIGEFARSFGEDPQFTPETLARALAAYFQELMNKHIGADYDKLLPGVDELGFIVAGYDGQSGAIWEVGLPSGTVQLQSQTQTGGALWRGQPDVIVRLVKGYDIVALKGRVGAGPAETTKALDALEPDLLSLEYVIDFQRMNLQDAIDFAVLGIRTTIDVQRLTLGRACDTELSWPGVGGPIEIAAVTPRGGFKWIQRTSLQGERPAGTAELT
ncbi:MAG: hypothetical protein QOG03_682 [Actinomycetota bacterium]|jgi:hypothetical protein|nr:hypothetical protein [Actinomycetota bacterium]